MISQLIDSRFSKVGSSKLSAYSNLKTGNAQDPFFLIIRIRNGFSPKLVVDHIELIYFICIDTTIDTMHI